MVNGLRVVWLHFFDDVTIKMVLLHRCTSIEDEGIALHLLLTESSRLVFQHLDSYEDRLESKVFRRFASRKTQNSLISGHIYI